MRRAPEQVATLVETEDRHNNGWLWATYRLPCGHDRMEQYPPSKQPPATRRLHCYDCGKDLNEWRVDFAPKPQDA